MKPSLIIIGLGNPGKEYVDTRHNAGFLALEELKKNYGTGEWKPKQKFLCDACEARIITMPVLLVKPTTFMNRSGECARKIIDFYGLDPSNALFVISDDIDLEPGTVRFRESGSAGTHNGLQSIVDQFGEIFARIRIGVGRQKPGTDLATYVLSAPSKSEKVKINESIATIPAIVREFVLGNGSVDSRDTE